MLQLTFGLTAFINHSQRPASMKKKKKSCLKGWAVAIGYCSFNNGAQQRQEAYSTHTKTSACLVFVWFQNKSRLIKMVNNDNNFDSE